MRVCRGGKIESELHGDMQTAAEMSAAHTKVCCNNFKRNSLSGGQLTTCPNVAARRSTEELFLDFDSSLAVETRNAPSESNGRSHMYFLLALSSKS